MKLHAAILFGFVLSGNHLHAAVVDTADNKSTAADGKTSLLEALTNLTAGETISFNIPGPGPHYIVTPDTGYPLITVGGVVIDGYSQPGATANTAGLREPNNAKIKIVLDSRTETPGAKRTVIDFPGFGTSESCILGMLDAQGVRIRGLAFIGVAGMDSDFDSYVYNTAFIKGSSGGKVQGCWFGLDPGVSSWAPGPDGVVAGVYGARSAVASFKGDGLSSAGLVFGTDGDGNGDRGEFNLCMAQRLAVHLETPAATVSGNWFNFFPDGSILRLETQGLVLEDNTLEAIENGDGTGMIIGTDGDGTADSDEGNMIGPVQYDTVAEFWRTSPGVVFAGNYVGMGLDGFPAFTLPGSSLVAVRRDSSVRIGSNMDNKSDVEEANHIHGLGVSFIGWHGSNSDGSGKPAAISLRRNELSNNYGGIPLDPLASVSSIIAYQDVMKDPALPEVTLNVLSTTTLLQGIAPEALTPGVSGPVIDVYLADAFGLYQAQPSAQGRSYLASYTADGPLDLNPLPGAFSFDISALGLTAAKLGSVTITANYGQFSDVQWVTTSFSPTLAVPTVPPLLDAFTISKEGAGLKLEWTGGTPPFQVFAATDPGGPWTGIVKTDAQSHITQPEGPRRFYRVREGAAP